MVAVDVEAHGKAAVRIDNQLGRRLTPRAAQSARFEYQSVLEQALGDVGDRTCREASHCGEVGARDESVDANRV